MAELGEGEGRLDIRQLSRDVVGRTLQEYVVPVIGDVNREMQVLSIGCGLALEFGAVDRIFPHARYTGMDIDEFTLRGARRMNADLTSALERAQFVVGDASRSDGFPGHNYDLVLIRNPQMKGTVGDPHRSGALWQQIIKNSTEIVTQGGILYIPTQDKAEQELVRRGLSETPVAILQLGENPHRNKQLPFNEAFVVVAKKV